MSAASMKQLLESGVHFGHQTRRWNPKMKPYIFTERGGIHIIDLQQTTVLLDRAYDFVRNIAGRGGTVLFVGTKKQCQDIVRDEALRVSMPYVSHRWLGGLLTNFATIENRIKRMHELHKLKDEGQLSLLPTKERMAMERELEKLDINLGGVSNMTRLPDAVFVADPKREAIATKEVNKLGIPLIGLCDTNCDPDEVDYVIPGNDDAIRSCSLIVRTLARAVEEGKAKIQVSEFLAAEAARAATSQAMPYSSENAEASGMEGRRGARGARSGGSDGPGRGQGRAGQGGRSAGGGRRTGGTWQQGRESGGREGAADRPAPARRPPASRSAAAPRKKEAPPEADRTRDEAAPTAEAAVSEKAPETIQPTAGAAAEAADNAAKTAAEAAPETAAEAAVDTAPESAAKAAAETAAEPASEAGEKAEPKTGDEA